MKLAGTILILLALQGTAVAASLIDYRVKRGDTCASIARHFYGDEKRVDLIHENNLGLGPLPHHLVPGSVLRIPPTVPPDAQLSFVRNSVDKFTPEKGRGRKNDALKRGDRVLTEQGASAEVAYPDASRLQLGENTLIVILGDASGGTVKGGTADDTTLVSGSLRAHLGDLVGRKPRAIATAAGRVELEEGEAQVHVDQAHATRLSVYRGSSSLTAQEKSVRVAAGYGTKVEQGSAPTPPHALPPAPVWVTPPPTFLFQAGPASFQSTYAAGPGQPSARWHVQVAADELFNALRIDSTVAAQVTSLDVQGLPAGRWFVRVSAIDGDSFEGPFLATSSVEVAEAALTPGAPGSVHVALSSPGGALACGIDDEPLAAHDAFEVAAHVSRRLRCAPADAQAHPLEVRIPPIKVTVLCRLTVAGPESGELDVSLHDESNRNIPGLKLVAKPEAPLKVDAFHEIDGHYKAEAHWPVDTARITTELADSEDLVGMKYTVRLVHVTPGAKPSEP